MGRVTVLTSATTIAQGVNRGTAGPKNSVIVKNPSTATKDVYIEVGNTVEQAALSVSNGYLLAAGEVVGLDLIDENVYGIVTSGTQEIHILQSKKG